MKKYHVLSTLAALFTAVSFSQASAMGQTYDPCCDYYKQNYGIDVAPSVPTEAKSTSEATIDPVYGLYRSYSGYQTSNTESPKSTVETQTEPSDSQEVVAKNGTADMADPTNYYQW